MADDVKVSNFPEPSTKESVAFELMRVVMNAENQFENNRSGPKPDRAYILDLYAECLRATKGRRGV